MPYLVLARKYRPQDFTSLIGQDAMVQTLSNAFKTDRIHHAYILTGVRGVGKTTTARILARAFNYVGKEGPRPTLDLSEPGEHCQAIIEGRHVDVMEMDAASNTGIDDIREIIDSVRYGPVSAPYKVYIIDEVHMLSKQAFNGLLKTLEEPPPYVKFIFATTEIRKVPVTILSRCQRFDLRRIMPETMTRHLVELLGKENIEFEAEALAMIVRAGEGSVRDCLSLSDQAIAFGDGKIVATGVRDMLGLADRGQTIDLFHALMGGEMAQALDLAKKLYDAGADPETIITDLADFTHLVTRMKIVSETAKDPALTPDERERGAEIAARVGMRALTRTWQILQTGASEVARAGNAMQAAEMVLVRLGYAADLPTPDEIIQKLANLPQTDLSGRTDPSSQTDPSGRAGPPGRADEAQYTPASGSPLGRTSGVRPQSGGGLSAQASQTFEQAPAPYAPMAASLAASHAPQVEALAAPQNFAQLVALAGAMRDLPLKHALESDIRPVSFEVGHLEIALTDKASRAIVATLAARLKQWTGRPWMVSLSTREMQAPTLREIRETAKERAFDEGRADPLVQAVLTTFPGAKLVDVIELDAERKPTKTTE